MARTDYACPFRIDPASNQAAQSPYAQHVVEMIEQILLTTPGERVDLPEFGCGLRRLLFVHGVIINRIAHCAQVRMQRRLARVQH